MKKRNLTEKIQHKLEKQQEQLLEKVYSHSSNSQHANNPDRSDLALRYEQNQRDVLLLVHAGEQLKEVEKALERIKNNTYGQCEYCGRDIHPARLETIPTTSVCINCREQIKKERIT